MVSPLPPRLRDTVDIQDRVRQDRANLDQLYVGFHGGRFPPSKRLGIAATSGIFDEGDDDDEEGDEQTTAWEYNDRHVVVVAGGQVATLSHEPLDESLQVYWHPRGLAYAPLRWMSEHFTVDTNRVTIPDTTSIIEAADAFSFQYQYLTGGDGEVLIDEFFIDSRSSATVVGSVVLDTGADYRVEVLGTCAFDTTHPYGSTVPLIYPSTGGPTFANNDIEWIYGSDNPGGAAYPRPRDPSFLEYRHGAGTWIPWERTTTAPNGGYTYDRPITGQGLALSFKVVDVGPYSDNGGKFRVQTFQE